LFRFSVTYLMWLFAALLVDHTCPTDARQRTVSAGAPTADRYQNLGLRAAVQLQLRRPRGARAIPACKAGTVHGQSSAPTCSRHAGRPNREVSALGAVEQAAYRRASGG